jgi:hypothetical protein
VRSDAGRDAGGQVLLSLSSQLDPDSFRLMGCTHHDMSGHEGLGTPLSVCLRRPLFLRLLLWPARCIVGLRPAIRSPEDEE